MNFLAYVYHIWRMKYWVIIITAVATLLGWYMTGLMSETYQAEALIFVKRNPNLNPLERKEIDPPVFQELLKSDALLNAVMEEYSKRYPNDEKRFKVFRKRFRVKGDVLTETAVRKDYSPIVVVTATAGSAESASFLVNTWQSLAIKMYGDLVAKEESMYYQYLLGEYNSINAELNQAQIQFSTDKWKLAAHIQSLSNWMDILSPSTLSVLPKDPKSPPPLEMLEQASQFDMEISDSAITVERKGLQNRLIELDIEIAELNEGAEALRALLKDEPVSFQFRGVDTDRLQQLLDMEIIPEKLKELESLNTGGEIVNSHYIFVKQKLAETEMKLRAQKAARQLVTEKIAEVEQKISALQASIAEVEPRMQQSKREIERWMKEQRLIQERMNISALSYNQLKWTAQNPMDTSSLFSAMQAVAPYQVGPKRLTYTGLIGIATGMLTLLLIVVTVFIADLETMFGRPQGAKPVAKPAATSKSQDQPNTEDSNQTPT